MHSEARQRFNAWFSTTRYDEFVSKIKADYPGALDFRAAESPVFIPLALKQRLVAASEGIIDVLASDAFLGQSARSIPAHQFVPNENTHTSFLAIDFAISKDGDGALVPKLIELQGFPSVFAYQAYLSELFKKVYPIDDAFFYAFGAKNEEKQRYSGYFEQLGELILGEEHPENVILLDIFPEKQKTRIDFVVTEQMLGVKAVCYTKLIREGRKLFYELNGRRIQIKRIYNRLIFDDLQNFPGLKTDYKLTDDVEVSWVGHPNWFFRISKFSMPFLTGDYVPSTKFLSDFGGDYPTDLHRYVLKPLFSFAGSGVQLDVTPELLSAISDTENYILQEKVTYEPVIATPDGTKVKCEIRMLYIWPEGDDRPQLLTSLSRLSRGKMIGVQYNKDQTWVGSSACFFERD